METSVESRRLIVCCAVFAAAVGAVILMLNVPTQIVRIHSRELGSSMISHEFYAASMSTPIEKAGWPMTYRIRFLSSDGTYAPEAQTPAQTLYFSWFRLVVNGLFGLVAMGFVAWFTRTRHCHIHRSANPNQIRRLYDFATASCCFAVPAIIFLVSAAASKRHCDFAKRLVVFGQCTLAAEVPSWMAGRIPKALSEKFMRITDVGLVGPDNAILEELAFVDTLRSVRIHRADLNANNLLFLSRSKTISNLAISYCRFDSLAIDRISSMNQLRWLSLHGCPLDNDDLNSLNSLTCLEGADLSRTGIRLSEFVQPGWANSIRHLRLSRPASNNSDRLKVVGWTKLTELSVQDFEQQLNDETLTLELADCPSLTSLHLDRWQKHALIATNLPLFRSIYEPVEFVLGGQANQSLPSMTRWQKLELSNLASLSLLECQAGDLESIRLSGMPQLRSISLGSNQVNQREQESREGVLKEGANADRCGKIFVNAISQLDSINEVRIKDVRLDRDDIKNLCRIPYLHELHCVNTQLSESDLAELETKESLQLLDLGELPISQQRLTNLVKLPQLKTIRANLSQVEELQIVRDKRIESLETRPLRHLRTLELTDLPRYCGGVVIQNQVERLHLNSVPLLRELIIECPWPNDYSLEGVDGLLRFAAGGTNLRDSLIDQLAKCRELDQLSLAYPQISRDKLKRIGAMKQLTSLEVPGCLIDDEVVSTWNELTRLRRVCFDDTAIGADTIRWLSTQESLRSVSLNHLRLDENAQAAIASLIQISDLSLVQTEWSDEAFAQFLPSRSIEILNLSETRISGAKLDAIARSNTLRYCVFNDCGLSPTEIRRLLDEQPRLHIEINNKQELPLQLWATSVVDRIHDASTSDRWSHRFGQQYRSTIQSVDHHLDSEIPQFDSQLVGRPFSLALFRKQPSI
ncbi:leucine-rich repeat domain-containing protein [Neorhodopirellula pilleata]|uniref:Leucine Rich repeats (2 copies) n=1 Tax=Neorhodopirellula pilleata TaxID=2714738 RepID=A0A5C5ZKR0_9BACT|nr:hypothetical protein [Neorhodopirellula pilleata]TWT87820.1 hypothetical protein Pla100_59150 [Neorhodopirellula pilleata]